MVTWQLQPDETAATEWDKALLESRDYAVFQSYGWGEFKRLSGWQPQRWIGRDGEGRVVAMVQFLLKTAPLGFGMAWAPGGPVMSFRDKLPADIALAGLLRAMKAVTPRLLVRFDSYLATEPMLVDLFGQTCRRPNARIGSGYSMHFDISDGAAGFSARMTSKHRYYLRKADAADLRWEAGSRDRDIAALAQLHRAMTVDKSLKTASMTESDYAALRAALGASALTILTGYLADRPVTSCLTLDFGRKSFYFVAATGPDGRRVGAAYAMMPQLIDVLHGKGIVHFDFGGIAPGKPSARGVDHFKKGFGGKTIAYVGEWEWASVPLLAPAVGLLMQYRGMAV